MSVHGRAVVAECADMLLDGRHPSAIIQYYVAQQEAILYIVLRAREHMVTNTMRHHEIVR